MTTRGQVRRTTQHTLSDGDITTSTIFDIAGEPSAITKQGFTGGYGRSVVWDSLGRMIANYEDNTTSRNTGAGWRYAWDDTNRLVGTSDARGCGEDIYYDALGRVVGEDYSPCRASHAPYSAADGASGTGFEVLNSYDAYEADQVASDSTFIDDSLLATGRLVATQDRGAHTRFSYDNRGRVRRTDRQVAKPLSQQVFDASIYAPHLFSTRSDFDNADRLTYRTGGGEDAFTMYGRSSAEYYAYSPRGLLASIASDYGNIIQSITSEVDGQPTTMVYGDIAATKAAFVYDPLKLQPFPLEWTAEA
jgi:YD repeat-containing protein